MAVQKTKRALKGLLILGVVLLACRCFWAWQTVARIAGTVERHTEMGFGPLGEPDRFGRSVCQTIDVEEWFPRGVFDVVLRPVREFEIYYFEHLRGDLGKELQRFPHLKKVSIYDNMDGQPSESEWQRLLGWIRQMPDLEELDIGGDRLTDAALASLAGHPRLRMLTVDYSRLTKRSLATFQSLHGLRQLSISDNYQPNFVLLPLELDDIQGALPAVSVTYDGPRD